MIVGPETNDSHKSASLVANGAHETAAQAREILTPQVTVEMVDKNERIANVTSTIDGVITYSCSTGRLDPNRKIKKMSVKAGQAITIKFPPTSVLSYEGLWGNVLLYPSDPHVDFGPDPIAQETITLKDIPEEDPHPFR